jgi:transcription elongation factor Elf1
MKETKWIFCPICGGKTRTMIRVDTELKKYPLFCPKCKQETLIDVKKLQIIIIKEPDALDAEPMN